MLFIYWMEADPAYAGRIHHILKKMDSRRDVLYASPLVVGEVLVAPRKKNAANVIAQIESYFRSDAVTLIAFDYKAAICYSQLRAQMTIEPADAIHLACAATEGTDLFITNDKRLIGKNVPGIQFIVGLDTNLF
jgi:predicted nucleic acid-binding protein